LLGAVPEVEVFQTKVPANKAPPFGLTTGAATFLEVSDTFDTKTPLVDELTSRAPLGVVVPIPT